jgi:light-independent protochlorophyllide reductase subunit B
MFGSQMERHSASEFGVPCAVVSPPSHILNFPLGYAPFIGYDGANHIGDLVNQTQVLGLEHHLIETFGPRGQGRFAEAAPEPGDDTGSSTGAASAGAASAGATNPGAADTGAELQPAGSVAAESGPRWDAAAERLLGRVPFFVRKKARANVEKYARERDIATIDEAVMLRAREHVGG